MRRYNDDFMVVRIHIQFWRILDGEGGYIHDGMEGAEMRLNGVCVNIQWC